MEKKTFAFIWDLDGTLLDSYTTIVRGLVEAYRRHGVALDPTEVHSYIIKTSSKHFTAAMEEKTGLPSAELNALASALNKEMVDEIGAIEGADKTLSYLASKGAHHFVFTHRGATSHTALSRLGLKEYFDEIVTSENGFPSKPAPDAVLYLMKKYRLLPETTFYVGDRQIDMDCAKNAGIGGFFYRPAGSFADPIEGVYTVSHLPDVISIFDELNR